MKLKSRFIICALFLQLSIVYAEEKPRAAVIVDAYGIANEYPNSFKAKGLLPIHIQGQKELLPVFRTALRQEAYHQLLAYEGDLQKLIDELAPYDIQCVIAGVEPGVELADLLSETLQIRSNGTALSSARRDKYEMGLQLQKNEIPTPHFQKIKTYAELLDWIDRERLNYPIVLKPLKSGATDGVFICHNQEELKLHFEDLIGKTNILGHVNEEILAQSFLEGEEYVVNSVSLNGKDYIVAILESKKRLLPGYGFIYDREKMMESSGPIQDLLVDMHHRVLRALNIDHGPAHGEYMLTKKGPILIEVASRISGGVHPKANSLSVGCNQIDLTVDAYTDPDSFHQQTQFPYQRKKHFYQVLLSNPTEGTVQGIDQFISELQKLPSFCDVRMRVKEGAYVRPTIDLISSLGNVFLVNEDPDILEADYLKASALAEKLVHPIE